MKKTLLIIAFTSLLMSGCEVDDWTEGNGTDPFSPGGGSGSGTSSGIMDFGTLAKFTVELNTAKLTETETIPSDESDAYYNEYIENNFTAKNTTTITFNAESDASISGQVKGDTIEVKGGAVLVKAHSKGLTLKVAGTSTNGYLKVWSEKKWSLDLAGVTLTNPDGAAINIQEGNCFVVLSGDNSLSDGASAAYKTEGEEDMKAVLFSEDDLRFSGTGSLKISANNAQGKNGISSDDAIFIRPNTNIQITSGASAGHGIKANDAVVIKGGVVNIETAGKGTKGVKCDGYIEVAGGRLTAITTGGVDTSVANDPTGCAAMKADSVINISGGELHLKSTGQGGKGINADQEINISGGTIYALTTGNKYSASRDISTSPKGIRSEKDINISGGDIFVRTEGSNGEGLESKASLNFTGGNTAAYAYDDGFNAASSINISGGKALAISTGDGDGMDSNGTINATGGVLIGVASTLNSEDGIDFETKFTIGSDATVIGLCAQGMGSMGGGFGGFGGGSSSSKYSGSYISTKVTGSAGDYVSLTDNSGTPLVTFQLPRTYNSGSLEISAPGLKSSTTYKLQTGVTPTGGTLWMNYYNGATSVSGGSSTSVTSN